MFALPLPPTEPHRPTPFEWEQCRGFITQLWGAKKTRREIKQLLALEYGFEVT
jgi:hypothetical protein